MTGSFIGASLKLAPTLIVLILFSCGTGKTSVTLAFLGDLMLGRSLDPQVDSLVFLEPELSSADLTLANLESPFDRRAAQQTGLATAYNLCASSDYAALLSIWSIDLLSVANNHRLDCRSDGLEETISILNELGLNSIGGNFQPVFLNVNGVRFAFLGFDDISSPLDDKKAFQAIRSARLDGALVVVSIHWGAEYQSGTSERQRFLATQFSDAGAAVVWGHHPHVLQPVVWIPAGTGSDFLGSSTLVLYSLGNALFDQGGLDDTRRSVLVVVTLEKEVVKTIRFHPFEIDVPDHRLVRPDAFTTQKIMDRLGLP